MIEETVINNRPCKVQHLDVDLRPVPKDRRDLSFVRFADGETDYHTESDDPVAQYVVQRLKHEKDMSKVFAV